MSASALPPPLPPPLAAVAAASAHAASALPLPLQDRSAAVVRDLVESAIESDDVGPLIKAVFEVQPPGEALPPPLPRGSESATTSQGGEQQQALANVLDAVLEMLAEVAEEKEAEIAQICRCVCGSREGGTARWNCCLSACQPHELPQLLLSCRPPSLTPAA